MLLIASVFRLIAAQSFVVGASNAILRPDNFAGSDHEIKPVIFRSGYQGAIYQLAPASDKPSRLDDLSATCEAAWERYGPAGSASTSTLQQVHVHSALRAPKHRSPILS